MLLVAIHLNVAFKTIRSIRERLFDIPFGVLLRKSNVTLAKL